VLYFIKESCALSHPDAGTLLSCYQYTAQKKAQNSHKENRSNEMNSQKIALARYLANAKFG
jgi:hypothetical protein